MNEARLLSDIILSQALPPPDVFAAWRNAEGWGSLATQKAATALAASVASVCAYHEDKLVGFGRAIGDGVMYAYLQDIIVDPAWRNRDVGRLMISSLLSQLEAVYPSGASVGLMAAQGCEGFYEKLGFIARPNDRFGAGMIKIL